MRKLHILLALAACTMLSCTKAETPSSEQEQQEQKDTTVTPIVDPEPVVPKCYNIPDEFKDCEFVAFVNGNSVCKDIVCASGWDAFTDSLSVKKGQSIALVALGRGAKFTVTPGTTGQEAKNYTVTPVPGTDAPAIWSCKSEADSANAATFNPVLRTFSLTLNIDNLPQDLDSVSFDLKQSESVAPASPGQYAGTVDNHFCIPVSKIGTTLNLLPMQSASKELFLVVNFHYKDKLRDCMVYFEKRASARYSLDVNLDMEEKDKLDSPDLTISGTTADGKNISIVQQISLWNHSLTPLPELTKNEGFKFRSGTNMAFRYGSGVTWINDNEDRDQNEPWIWPDNVVQIQKNISDGFDHFRIPIDEDAFVYSDCTPRTQIIENIKEMADAAIEGGARVIIDLHWMKTCQYVPNAQNEAHFRACWQVLHETFCDYPTDMLAYEFMNEPNAPAEYWNFFIKNSIDMARQWGGKELNRILVCACNHGQDYSGTAEIELPSDTDPNLILSYHDYYPSNLTFYEYNGLPPVAMNYPGILVEDWENCSAEQLAEIPGYWLGYHKYDMEGLIKSAAENGERLGVRVYVGEYGCQPYVSLQARRNWFRDKCDLFRQYNMAFATWFGLGKYPYDPVIDTDIKAALFDE